MFIQQIHRLHGMPGTIVSDRDSRFTTPFWRSFMKALGTSVQTSTAIHAQSDRQSEQTNRTMQTMLRAFVSSRQDDWPKYLSPVEFAYNDGTLVREQHHST